MPKIKEIKLHTYPYEVTRGVIQFIRNLAEVYDLP